MIVAYSIIKHGVRFPKKLASLTRPS
jgi:hypothetical protein